MLSRPRIDNTTSSQGRSHPAKGRSRRGTWPLVVLTVLGAGCSAQMDIQVIGRPDTPPLASRDRSCAIRMYETTETLPATCQEVGDVYVGDTGYSVDCDYAQVRERAREQACLFGADAIQEIRRQHPDFNSSCYQVRARLLRCTDPVADKEVPG